jgi:phospholipid/cholesterol/gamma-HCH transport system permease protein
MYWKETLRQMHDIGVDSMIIVTLVALFIGAVTAVQTAYQLFGTTLVPMYYLGIIVRDTTILELAPTVTCLILAGKVGSNIASELGTMRISEQIDALEIMGVNSASYLIGPKIVAAMIMIPLLVIMAAALGMGGGLIATLASDYVPAAVYQQGLLKWFREPDVILMLVKAVTFGFLISSVSSYQGYYVTGGALELGKASTRAVVFSCILILVADYVIAVVLL